MKHVFTYFWVLFGCISKSNIFNIFLFATTFFVFSVFTFRSFIISSWLRIFCIRTTCVTFIIIIINLLLFFFASCLFFLSCFFLFFLLFFNSFVFWQLFNNSTGHLAPHYISFIQNFDVEIWIVPGSFLWIYQSETVPRQLLLNCTRIKAYSISMFFRWKSFLCATRHLLLVFATHFLHNSLSVFYRELQNI